MYGVYRRSISNAICWYGAVYGRKWGLAPGGTIFIHSAVMPGSLMRTPASQGLVRVREGRGVFTRMTIVENVPETEVPLSVGAVQGAFSDRSPSAAMRHRQSPGCHATRAQ
jgi:hypothetical protein